MQLIEIFHESCLLSLEKFGFQSKVNGKLFPSFFFPRPNRKDYLHVFWYPSASWELELNLSGGEVAEEQHSRHCSSGRSLRRSKERLLEHQHDSGCHQKKEPAGIQDGISKFYLEGGGKMAKVSMKNNSEPHLPLIFLMWTKNFRHWKIIVARELPSPSPALSSLST